MNPRVIRMLLILGAGVAGLVFSFVVVLLINGPTSSPSVQQTANIGGPFRLTDQNGKTFTDQDLKGRPFLVFFGFTHCPEVCPTTLFEGSEILRKLGPDADRVGALFVTVDPERDTVPVLKDYLSSFDPHLAALTGELADITAVAKAYRAYFKKVPLEGSDYTMDHTAIVYLMDKQGRFVSPFSIKRAADVSVADLRKQL